MRVSIVGCQLEIEWASRFGHAIRQSEAAEGGRFGALLAMKNPNEKAIRGYDRKTGRINFNGKAWRRLRDTYADQPISSLLLLQNRFSGIWLSVLERMAYWLSRAPADLPEVIFVVGHWRSGTTFLHEMLCQDPGLNFPTTYACMNPQVFPITEAAVLKYSGDRSVLRPMDNMSISLASPQEDEFALLALGAPSPYAGFLFPRFLGRAMAVADPEDLPESEQQEWIRVFFRFLGQVAARKPGCPVILKSPTHSYRVKLLSRLFPNARFIHIVRNPVEVYDSTMNMWKKLCSLYAVSDLPDDNVLAGQVIANWITLEEKLDAAIPGLGDGKYVRVHYEILTAHPLEEMKRIYATLGLERITATLPHVERYLAAHVHIDKNRFDPTPDKVNKVYPAWRHIFQKYGYAAPTA